jgi:hypothetical protein
MIRGLLEPDVASIVLLGLAQLFIIFAGCAVMLSYRRFASRLFLVGVFLVIAAVVAPGALTHQQEKTR